MLLQFLLYRLVTTTNTYTTHRVCSFITISILPVPITQLHQSTFIARCSSPTQPRPHTYLLVSKSIRLHLLQCTLVIELDLPQSQLVPPQHLLVPSHCPHVLVVLFN
jgi:hypothetical protein